VKARRYGQGYSLIELLIVMAVLGILAWAATPMVEIAAQRTRERELKEALWTIRHAIDEYRAAVESGLIDGGRSTYPETLETLVQGRANLRRPGEWVYFLRRVPRDPFALTSLKAEQTWALRSYASPPERPAPGDDVYDVHSRSDRVGLNGIPLKEW